MSVFIWWRDELQTGDDGKRHPVDTQTAKTFLDEIHRLEAARDEVRAEAEKMAKSFATPDIEIDSEAIRDWADMKASVTLFDAQLQALYAAASLVMSHGYVLCVERPQDGDEMREAPQYSKPTMEAARQYLEVMQSARELVEAVEASGQAMEDYPELAEKATDEIDTFTDKLARNVLIDLQMIHPGNASLPIVQPEDQEGVLIIVSEFIMTPQADYGAEPSYPDGEPDEGFVPMDEWREWADDELKHSESGDEEPL